MDRCAYIQRPADTAAIIGSGSGSCDTPKARRVLPATQPSHGSDGTPAPACEYGGEVKGEYIYGEATDNGKVHPSMADAVAACSADSYCGGVVSRGCNQKNTVCTVFITRSGWPSDCHVGVPCDPTSMKDVTPGWQALQNSYLIVNAGQCGHGPKTPAPTPGKNNGKTGYTHATAVWDSMTAVDPDATWVYQAWPWMRSFMETASGYPSAEGAEYMRNFTSAVPRGRLVMLDMRAECIPIYFRTDSFYNTSFIFEVMDDFGQCGRARRNKEA